MISLPDLTRIEQISNIIEWLLIQDYLHVSRDNLPMTFSVWHLQTHASDCGHMQSGMGKVYRDASDFLNLIPFKSL